LSSVAISNNEADAHKLLMEPVPISFYNVVRVNKPAARATGTPQGVCMKFFLQLNNNEPIAFETRDAFDEALIEMAGKGWVREWQDSGDGWRRMYKRVWR
jgi:hypothetical protein